jgi:uncharacterized integral membrane protein (TIGR02327 family)
MEFEIPNMMDSVAKTAGFSSVFNIMVTLGCIWVAWWALQNFRFDVFMRNPKGPQSKLLMVMLSIVVGHAVATFIIDYIQWSLLLKWLV